MKKYLLSGAAGGAITAALVGPGLAADLPVKSARPVVAPIALYNWDGFYLGGHLGWGRTKFNGIWFGDTTTEVGSSHGDGILGGFLLGYNRHLTNTLVGSIEGDLSFLNWKGDTVFSHTDGGEVSGKLKMLASLRARLGVEVFNDQNLLFASFGLGWAQGKVKADEHGSKFDATMSKFGPVVGIGWDHAFSPYIIGRIEGLYYFLKDTEKTGLLSSDRASMEFKDALVVRAALIWRFGP